MKIGILLTNIGNFSKYGFYNAQEIGLAKALDHLGEQVIIYKAAAKETEAETIPLPGCSHTLLHLIPVSKIGKHGLWSCRRTPWPPSRPDSSPTGCGCPIWTTSPAGFPT